MTFLEKYVTLFWGDDMVEKLKYYDDELDYYYVIKVQAQDEIYYAYNQHTLVHSMEFAKRYGTLRSAKRCISLSNWQSFEILKLKRPAENRLQNKSRKDICLD